MNVTITDSAIPLTNEDIAAAEHRLGCSIPTEYRTFLLAHNGGRPNPCGFLSYEKSGKPHDMSVIDWFFGINTGAYYNDMEERYNMVLEHRVPSLLFPVASDPGGNLICISIEGADTGKVYFWDHEFEAGNDGDTPTHVNVFFVASSFNEFIKELRNVNDDGATA